MAESLSDKLKSLGVQIGAKQLPERKPARPKGFPIQEVVPGRLVETRYGLTYACEASYPQGYRHGVVTMQAKCSMHTLCQWGQVPALAERDLSNLVFLDTETTGLAGGTGTLAFLIGLGYWNADGFHLVQLFLEEPSSEAAMIAALTETLSPFAGVVTFNGKTFDIPLLNSRHVINGFTPPFSALEHIDLLQLARRLWRNRLPSRALSSLEGEILGFQRTGEDIPGWMIPDLYYQYLTSRDARPLAGVFYHNAMDILSLAALFNHCAQMLEQPRTIPDPESLDLIAIARLYEDLGSWDQAVELYELALSQGLPRDFLVQSLMRIATIHKKHMQWDLAVPIWKKAAEYGLVEACLELAKHCEHRRRDYREALRWTQRAEECLPGSGLGIWGQREMVKDLARRRNRLVCKLERCGAEPDSELDVLE